ncbi:aspartyl/asparaginyl beta-hydroxylase isoform X4 [Aedes aegypti]|uniref:Aspartyl/asparaginy/proline hydroxylase domain-containing protein n=1 Tax=Aedes aegypti TaxID=7159 RepID=A0A6I8U9S1_AEDAE|nr:aspartyl/asparaginyl beta-hydroxylase isoform X4 [Aedes aegypti]
MSGDVQPRKRKDKKRKKDDEDTVKETPAPKVTAGAAQAATQPGDIQMHVHNDHGTGGHWCAKVVFFILLTGLGALIGLIILENRGVSNADTPLSESRYAEYFDGWVDENREDDHHHEEILEALNQLDEHEDEDEAHGEADDHGDEEDEDDGAPYAEEEDHDDERDLQDEEDEGELPKLDDDEVEEIVATEKKVAQQEARAAADNDDDDDDAYENEEDENEGGDEADQADAEEEEEEEEEEQIEYDETDELVDEADEDADDDENDEEDDATKTTAKTVDDDHPDDDNDNDDGDENDDGEDKDTGAGDFGDDNDDDDDDDKEPELEQNDDDGDDEEDGDTKVDQDGDDNDQDADDNDDDNEDGDNNRDGELDDDDDNEPVATGNANDDDDDDEPDNQTAEDDDDENDSIAKEINQLAEDDDDDDTVEGNSPFDEEDDDDQVNDDTFSKKAVNDKDDGDQDDDEDDDEDNFENFVDNDGGEEEYLAKLRKEQEQRNQQKQQEEKDEPREESSLVVQILVGAALIGAARILLMPSARGSTPRPQTVSNEQTAPSNSTYQHTDGSYPSSIDEEQEANLMSNLSERLLRTEMAAANLVEKAEIIEELLSPRQGVVQQPRSVMEDFVNAAGSGLGGDDEEIIEGNVILIEGDDGELYSGDEEYDYEPEDDYGEELEEIEEEEEYEEEEQKLIEQELEIGSFVPTTFEEFSSMYRAPSSGETNESIPVLPEAVPVTTQSVVPEPPSKETPKTIHKESPLMKKKPPKGALNKLIYGLHKEPLITAEDLQQSIEQEIPSRPSESQIYEEELNRARRHLDELKNPKKALEEYETLLRKSRRLVPALVGKARALDVLAEQKQSNSLLSEAIGAYRDVVLLGDAVDDETARTAGERCIDRSRFRGQYLQVIDVHQELIRRFDSEPKYRNQLAVTYLLANRLPEAKAVLHETLMRWIDDGFALVHYGFVLKNLDKDMELAAQYLREGIETEQEGTQDGRFYFHLGDALQRLGRQQEALDVYRKGAEKKLFLSMYQRSLYNVDSLKSRPFWTVEQTTFAAQLELIQSQWTGIRDEGLKLLNSAGNFKDEAENLRDTGDWKQFELFFRGYRIDKNCAKAPLTCRLVEQFTAARSCKRGQVKFSVMHPGTHVWPHCGPTNCRIRAHLGLKVPSGTFIRVAEETRSWENGKWLIFDDSFEHEVWHNGTSTRLVLIVDFWHPDLTESQRKSLSPI